MEQPPPTLVPTEALEESGAAIPFPLDFTFPFLDLPAEVRLKIYQFMFRRHIPIYPTMGPRKCKTTFTTDFLRVNRQIFTEATQVIWGQNQIVLQLPVKWDRSQQFQHRNSWRSSFPVFLLRECETFIPPRVHLHQILDLVIEVYLFRSSSSNPPASVPAYPATQAHTELSSLCKQLRSGHELRSLEIRFSNMFPRTSPTHELMPWAPDLVKHYSEYHIPIGSFLLPAAACCRIFPVHRPRVGPPVHIETSEKRCRQAINTDQQVLSPLTVLRGVGNVNVIGRVTNEWAEYLKMSMESPEGTEVQDFEHKVPDRWYKGADGKRRKRKGRSQWAPY